MCCQSSFSFEQRGHRWLILLPERLCCIRFVAHNLWTSLEKDLRGKDDVVPVKESKHGWIPVGFINDVVTGFKIVVGKLKSLAYVVRVDFVITKYICCSRRRNEFGIGSRRREVLSSFSKFIAVFVEAGWEWNVIIVVNFVVLMRSDMDA